MKKTDIFLAVSVALYSYLFYQQALGANILLFSLLQIAFFYSMYKESAKVPVWQLSAFGVFTSALSIFVYGSTLGIVANIISLGALAFCSISPGTSLIMGLFHNAYTVLGSSVFVVFDIVNRTENKKNKNSKRMKNLVYYLIAFVIMMVFFALYRSANSMFKNITDKIDLSFISGEWIAFTLLGFLIIYGLYRYKVIPPFEKFDLNAKNDLDKGESSNALDKAISITSEKKTGVILFVMLNILLLLVNTTDIVFLYGGGEIPEGLNHSDIVHQGINALITSIIMAVGIILFFFRGRLNFIRNNKLLVNLSYIWIAQNVFMIVSTAYRNHLYISDYLLTYKRIGVYVYLALSIIGLGYTLLKIRNTKTNWYIVRSVGWSFFIVLIISTTVNWNNVIVKYNFNHAKANNSNIDFDYLVELSPKTLPLVYYKMETLNDDTLLRYSHRIKIKMANYIIQQENYDWRSYTLTNNKSIQEMKKMVSNDYIEEVKHNTYDYGYR